MTDGQLKYLIDRVEGIMDEKYYSLLRQETVHEEENFPTTYKKGDKEFYDFLNNLTSEITDNVVFKLQYEAHPFEIIQQVKAIDLWATWLDNQPKQEEEIEYGV